MSAARVTVAEAYDVATYRRELDRAGFVCRLGIRLDTYDGTEWIGKRDGNELLIWTEDRPKALRQFARLVDARRAASYSVEGTP